MIELEHPEYIDLVKSIVKTVKTTHKGEVSDYRAWTPDEYPDTERLLAQVVCDLNPKLVLPEETR